MLVYVVLMAHAARLTRLGRRPSQENFMPLLDLFQPGALQVEVAKAVMVAFNRSQTETLSDFLIVNGVMYIAKILHDSIDASTFEDEKRQISELILHFVRRVRPAPPPTLC